MRINYVCFRFLTSTGPCNKRLQRRWYLWAPSLCTCRTGTTCETSDKRSYMQDECLIALRNSSLMFAISSVVLCHFRHGDLHCGFHDFSVCRICNIMDFEKTNCFTIGILKCASKDRAIRCHHHTLFSCLHMIDWGVLREGPSLVISEYAILYIPACMHMCLLER